MVTDKQVKKLFGGCFMRKILSGLFLFFVIIIFCACEEGGSTTTTTQNQTPVPVKVFNAVGDLPTCDADSEGNLYYVTDISEFRYCDGTSYQALDLSGSDGVSISWQGSLSSAPSNPQLNWAYYDTTEKIAYIGDGDSWEILCQDGQDAGSLSVSGSVTSGSSLSLQHNLNRDDLTFTAQFIKDGYICIFIL
jgi:hypothetical protein